MIFSNDLFLERTVENAPVGICIIDAFTLVSEVVNEKFLQIIGKPREAIVGKVYWDAFAEARQTAENALFETIKTGDSYPSGNSEFWLVVAGTEQKINITFDFTPVKNDEGKVAKIAIWATHTMTQRIPSSVTIDQDIVTTGNNNRKSDANNPGQNNRYHAITESEASLEQVIAQLPNSIVVITGEDLIVEKTNETLLRYWHKTKEEVIGKPLLQILPELKEQPFPAQLHQVMATGETIAIKEGVVNLNLPNGDVSTTYVDYSYQPLYNQNGDRVGVIVVSDDVTEKVKSRRLLENLAVDLQELNEESAAANEELAATNEQLSTTQQTLENSLKELSISENKFRLQKQRLERFIMQAPAGICVLSGEELVFELVNPLYQQLYPGRKLLNKPIFEALPEIKGSPVWDLLRNVYQTGKTFEGKEQLIPIALSDNAPLQDRYFDFIYQARLNEKGEIDGVLVFVIDVTDNVKSRHELKANIEKNARLAAIVSTSDDTILSKTLGGIITSWNAAAERMFGYTAEEAIGQHISLIIPPARLNEENFIISQVTAGKKVEHFETVRMAKDGREIHISLTVSPIFNEDGTISGASKIARDISERHKNELRKNDFIGMVSHELKTPLTSLTALIQVTKYRLAKTDDAFLFGAMTKAEVQAKKMAKMINGFLNISRLESGKIAIDMQYFDIAELMKEVKQEVQTTYSSHDIIFDHVEPTQVHADQDKIGHVLNNLINNAVKYSPARSTIKIACGTADGYAIVSVKDQGIGISSKDAGQLFDRYYRVEDENTKHISGFGIGLYLSAEIIARHEGKIWVDSQPGAGSTFYFTLPLVK